MCFYSIHTKRERKRLCELKQTMQPTKQEQWQTAEVTSQRKQPDISSHPQCNINLQYRLKGTNNFDSVIKRPGKNGKRGCHRGGLLAHYYLSKIHRFQKGPAIFVNHNLVQKFLTQSELGVQLWISPARGLVTLTSLHWGRWARRIDRTPTTPSCCDLYTPLASWLVFRGRRTRRKRSRWRGQSSAFRRLFIGFGAGLSRARWRRRRWRHFSFFGPASVFLCLSATWTRSATRLFLLDNFNTSLESLLGSWKKEKNTSMIPRPSLGL